MELACKFKLERETKGALRYQEVDDNGVPLEQVWAKVGTLYVRRTAFERGAIPKQLTVTIVHRVSREYLRRGLG